MELKNVGYRKIVAAGMLCSASLFAGQTGAAILGAAVNINPQTSPPLLNPTFLDLNSAAGNQPVVTFSTTAPNTRVVLTFSSECIVGGGFSNYLDIDIVIDPAGAPLAFVAAPTVGTTTSFCSGAGFPTPLPPALEGFPSVVQAIAVIPTAGVHTAQVRVRGFGSPINWRIDDLSFVIEN